MAIHDLALGARSGEIDQLPLRFVDVAQRTGPSASMSSVSILAARPRMLPMKKLF